MSTRPRVASGLLAGLLEQAPARVRRRLDDHPTMAQSWQWSSEGPAWTVAAGNETVRLNPADGVLAEPSQVACSCLLTPRCLHLIAVLSTLDAAAPTGRPGDDPADDSLDPADPVTVTGDQLTAARLCWQAAARLLGSGATGAGMTQRAEILRAAHAARQTGLHRSAAAATRVAVGLRDLQEGRPAFTLAGYAADLAELLVCAWRLGAGPAGDRPQPVRADIGIGRRTYRPLGALRLHGLFTEAVVTTSGYAGVVTYLADESARLWSVADVLPGRVDLVAQAYRGAVRLGSLALTHQALGRSTLFGQGMTGSADGRLGSGQGVHVARTGDSDWSSAPLDRLWADPIEVQLDRACAASRTPSWAHTAGSYLMFLEATVAGLDGTGLALRVNDGVVRGIPPVDGLTCISNLRRLGSLTGVALRVIGRIDFMRPRTITLLAAGGCDDLRLPDTWRGRANLGLDEIPGIAGADAASAAGQTEDPLAGLRRVLHRMAAGGRITAGPAAAATLSAEAARLRRTHLTGAAALIDRLASDASSVQRSATGESRPTPPDATARTWMSAMAYENAARLALLRSCWTGSTVRPTVGSRSQL